MFKINGTMKFINVDINYLKELNAADPEVRYNEGYEKKPFMGILINDENGKEYAIPLSSAKEKHKNWSNTQNDSYLISEIVPKDEIKATSIFVDLKDGTAKQILSVLDIKKMIPVSEDLYNIVDLVHRTEDSKQVSNYKILLNKEYRECLKIADSVVKTANKIYNQQIETGNISKFCNNFKKLEEVLENYQKEEKSEKDILGKSNEKIQKM